MRERSRRRFANRALLLWFVLHSLVGCSGSYQPVTSYRGEANARHVDPYDTELVKGQVLALSLHGGERVWGVLVDIDSSGLTLQLGRRTLAGKQEARCIQHAEVDEMWTRGPSSFPGFISGFALGTITGVAILGLISVSQ